MNRSSPSSVTLRPLVADIRGVEVSTHEFSTADGVTLALTRFCRRPSDDVVLLVPPMVASADFFVAPEHDNLVSFLLDNGYGDVWVLEWRTSARLPYSREKTDWSFDDVALYDMPAALVTLRKVVGNARVHAVAHGLGALTLSMSLAAGLVTGLASLTCGSVCLYTRVAEVAKVKLATLPELARRLLGKSFVPVDFKEVSLFSRPGLVAAMAATGSRSCENPSCQLINFLWGSGRSPCFQHANLPDGIHRRLQHLFGPAPLSFFDQLALCAWAEKAVKQKLSQHAYASLPDDYLAGASRIDCPLLLLTGSGDELFFDSNQLCHAAMKRDHASVDVTLEVIPGYGHNDIFLGSHAAFDVFPRLLAFLRAHSFVQASSVSAARVPPSPEAIADMIVHAIAVQLDISADVIDRKAPMSRFGIDSIMAADIAETLSEALDRTVPLDLLLDLPDIETLSHQLARLSAS